MIHITTSKGTADLKKVEHTFDEDYANDTFAFVHDLGTSTVNVFLRNKDGVQTDVDNTVQNANLVLVNKPGGYDEGDTLVVMG